MSHQRSKHGFMAVDVQPDPSRYVLCLDTLHQERFYQTYKARIRALLRP
jgi:hypothetical protein